MPKADDYRVLELVQPMQMYTNNGKLQAALLPFARAASDYEPPKSKLYRDEEHVALRITAGDLRTARHVLLENKQPATTERRYSLVEIQETMRQWLGESRDIHGTEELALAFRLSMFIEWLKKREREREVGDA